MAKKNLINLFGLGDEPSQDPTDEYYDDSEVKDKDDKDVDANGNKMILLEPRAYSESQQIADHLKKRNSVVVNLKRVTSDQAKRIIDFLSGCIYAIGGTMQKVGVGIYLCAPNNVSVQGKITEETDKSKDQVEDEVEW
jgi:FtsZ-interacting cell division protein YlmF